MSDNYIYDKQLIRVDDEKNILLESKSTENNYDSKIYFCLNDQSLYIGHCVTDKTIGIIEWIEYDDQYLVLFSKSVKDNKVKIAKLYDINNKEFINGDEEFLINVYYRRKNKIKSKK